MPWFGSVFDRFDIEIDKIRTSIPKLQEALEKLYKEISDKKEYVSWLRERNNKEWLQHTAQGRAFNVVSKIAAERLYENTLEAIKGTEYDYPGLGERLLDVIRNNDKVITIEPIGNSARIRIHLDETAGTLEEYANAVKAAKEELGVGKAPEPAASQMWAEKIYGVAREGVIVGKRKKPKAGRGRGSRVSVEDWTDRYKGKYERTIEARIRNFKKPAPWWSLLNNGNHSGRIGPGDPYPITGPTRFVSKTVLELTDLYKDTYSTKFREADATAQDSIKWAKDRISDAERAVRLIRKYIADFDSEGYERANELVREQLERFSDDRLRRADPEKLIKLAQDLANGIKVGRRRLGNDVRLRTVQIERALQEEINKLDNVR